MLNENNYLNFPCKIRLNVCMYQQHFMYAHVCINNKLPKINFQRFSTIFVK